MITGQHYPHAPITEAIIDIRIREADSSKLTQLDALSEQLKADYPTRVNRNYAQGRFEFGKEISTTASQNPVGYLFKSTDEKDICQARLDGFTLSRLAPYESWDPFRNEARRLWKIYEDALKPEEIVRLAVRYINRIEIPLPIDDLSDYLRIYPEIPEGQPNTSLSGLFMKVSIPQEDINATCMITEALEKSRTPKTASIILDIDLYRDQTIPQAYEEMWDYFEMLHDRKNVIFESCITNKSRELFV
jgi:uncharacterized protein (TIGR04255 family)